MKYPVKSTLQHDGKEYLPGSFVEMTEAQAAAAKDAVDVNGAVEAEPTPAKKDQKK